MVAFGERFSTNYQPIKKRLSPNDSQTVIGIGSSTSHAVWQSSSSSLSMALATKTTSSSGTMNCGVPVCWPWAETSWAPIGG